MEIKRTPLNLYQEVTLGDLETRKVRVPQGGSIRPLIHKDFIIEELSCKGEVTIATYDNYSGEYPARLLWIALEPDESRRFWQREEFTKNNESMVVSVSFEINRESWEILKEETSSKRPISFLLNVPGAIQNRRTDYSAATHKLPIYVDEENIFISASTWDLLEEPKEAKLKRWEKAMGAKGVQLALAMDLGEILLTPNEEEIYNRFTLKCVPFGGRA